ncbi:unnamed protein product [Euphydryas editha]|uniref:MYND-type domain-containing protein n=1 Tax=Euphydryas editha TaxID=104508 RepID=A0AAU9U1P2_EUPED|nr:unnamed protein product [Euphydryas editha]
MYHQPYSFHHFLTTNNLVDEIYDAMEKDDLSEIVMTAMKVLKTTNSLRPLNTIIKSAQMSEKYRNEGIKMYKNNDYKSIFLIYNQAILRAPKNSRELKLAISNRSALFYKLKVYKACLRDIDTCFEMGCPDDILIKLKKRRKDVKKLIAVEDFKQKYLHCCVDKFINCNIKRHPLVPCASTHVEFTGSDSPKIVAARDIKPGSVVSCEKAYICSTNYNYTLTACYYCQKYALNLIPCDNCCFAMFCDNICKDTCYHEYHKWECPIMEAVKLNCQSPTANLMFKVVLKMRSKCMSWKELIDASYSTGLDRMRTSSIGEIYNGNNLFSVLNVRNDKPFVYGILCNSSFICAGLLHYLEEIPLFYPRDSNEKQKAMQALGRIMLFLSIYQTPTPLFQHMTDPTTNESYSLCNVLNFGIFPFTGKLKKSCKPNLLVLNKNNELILIALRTIKSGEELTISFHQHLLNAPFTEHSRNVWNFLYGNVCDCSICNGHNILNAKGQLTAYQKKYYSDLNLNEIDKNLNSKQIYDAYNKLLKALDVLDDAPCSDEYKEIYKRFSKCTRRFETVKGQNCILDFNQMKILINEDETKC